MPDAEDASHALLLRLFQSEFFSPHLALSYLKTYSDSIGITYYLVERLRNAFDPAEVEFYWAQLCHLLISRPSKSRALEYFILQRCDESVHVALLTLWHCQAALFDLSANPHTDSFQVCQRIFNQCQRLLYDDPLADTDLISSNSGSNLNLGSSSRRRLRIKARSKKGEKVLPSNVLPSLVGMGAILASVPGMPSLSAYSGTAAIEQGRRKPFGRDRAPLEGSGMQRITVGDDDSNGSEGASGSDGASDDDDDDDQAAEGRPGVVVDSSTSNHTHLPSRLQKQGKGIDEPEGDLTGLMGSAKPAQKGRPSALAQHGSMTNFKGPASPTSPLRKDRTPTSPTDLSLTFSQLTTGFNDLRDKTVAAVNDVFGQKFGVDFAPGTQTKDAPAPPLWHRQHRRKESSSRHRSMADLSRNSISGDGPAARASTSYLPGRNSMSGSPYDSSATLADESMAPTPEAVLARYDREARRRLLRSNYCRRQTQFLQTLQDVSARLLLLPKPARLSALRAELTELNHSLPSEVCFPLWCEAAPQEDQEASDAIDPRKRLPKGAKLGRHHRVVRIDPSEAVVLNSADRVPYLLHVEVLTDDLDFDPERKANRESLKKLVMQEDVRRRKTLLSRQFSASAGYVASKGVTPPGEVSGVGEVGDDSRRDGTIAIKGKEESLGDDLIRHRTPPPLLAAQTIGRSSTPVIEEEPTEDGEEIDLTEQAYGSDLAAFGGDGADEESEEDDLAAINIDHDTAAWSSKLPERSRSGSTVQTNEVGHAMANKKREFSLDEYAERMRTAAIMLAQLNQSTNASAQPTVATNPHVSSTAQGGWSSWIMGTSWAAHPSNGGPSEAGQGSAGVKAPVITVNSAAGVGSMAMTGSNGPNSTLAAAAAAASSAHGQAYAARGAGKKLVHTDTEMIRKRIMQEMMALEEERMERMKMHSGHRRTRRGANVEDEATVQRAVNKDDPSAAMFRETWATKKARIRAASPYGHLDNWDVFSVIIKTGADLRQEQLAVQLIQEFARIWGETGSRCWVRYFRILVTSENSGIMETVTDAVSVHSIKKEAYARRQQQQVRQQQQQEQMTALDSAIQPAPAAPTNKIATYSLLDHFIDTFGDPSSAKFGKARQRFLESLAGYSIISYLLQIKDRHNGNILVDQEGHLIHIDFGFMLGISPGGVGFEAAPFKFTQEYIDVLGGLDSPKFVEFKSLLCQGFRDVRKHAERIIMIVELMQKESKLPCFALGDLTSNYLRDRFQLALSQTQCDEFVDRLIASSINSTFTRLYDQYQYYSEGILS